MAPRSQALPGNAIPEALPRGGEPVGDCLRSRGGASRIAFPGRAWERGTTDKNNEQPISNHAYLRIRPGHDVPRHLRPHRVRAGADDTLVVPKRVRRVDEVVVA